MIWTWPWFKVAIIIYYILNLFINLAYVNKPPDKVPLTTAYAVQAIINLIIIWGIIHYL
jgi:hypothetical protein